MSEAIIHADHGHAAHAHHEASFISTYVFSTDHKMIGKQFMAMGLFNLFVGGLLAMLVRWELAWPGTAGPGFSWVPEPAMSGGVIRPATYTAVITTNPTH